MIKAFERILVATDFSDPAYRAVERAIDLARRYEARLLVVHVWEPPLLVEGAPGGLAMDWAIPLEETARAQLDELVDGLKAGKLDVTAFLLRGVPSDQVLTLADAQHADLLVLGTHGRTGLARALMGSVAERIVRHATVPVLTIH